MINAYEEMSCNALQDSSAPTEIIKEAIKLGKNIGVLL